MMLWELRHLLMLLSWQTAIQYNRALHFLQAQSFWNFPAMKYFLLTMFTTHKSTSHGDTNWTVHSCVGHFCSCVAMFEYFVCDGLLVWNKASTCWGFLRQACLIKSLIRDTEEEAYRRMFSNMFGHDVWCTPCSPWFCAPTSCWSVARSWFECEEGRHDYMRGRRETWSWNTDTCGFLGAYASDQMCILIIKRVLDLSPCMHAV